MIRIDNLVQWQIHSPEDDAIFPWFTHPCLDWLKQQDFSRKRVLEFGAGRSSRWWRKKAAWVTSIDTSHEWSEMVAQECAEFNNGALIYLPINEGDQERAWEYLSAGDEYGPYEVIVNDGILRTDVCESAIGYFAGSISGGYPGILICDNWSQSGVWMSPKAEQLMQPYERLIFEQADHTDNDGVNKWKTAVFFIP
jgi:hypothetical protein